MFFCRLIDFLFLLTALSKHLLSIEQRTIYTKFAFQCKNQFRSKKRNLILKNEGTPMQARIRVEVLWPSHNQIENYFCNLIPNSYHFHVKFYKHRRLAYA